MSIRDVEHKNNMDKGLSLKLDVDRCVKKILEEVKKYHTDNAQKNVFKIKDYFSIQVKADYTACSMCVGRRAKLITCNIYYGEELVHIFTVKYLHQKSDLYCKACVYFIAKELKKHGYKDFKFEIHDLLSFKAS